jgi:hypothetical protein
LLRDDHTGDYDDEQGDKLGQPGAGVDVSIAHRDQGDDHEVESIVEEEEAVPLFENVSVV